MNISGLIFYFALVSVAILVGWFIGFVAHDIDYSRFERRTVWETVKRLGRLFIADTMEFIRFMRWGDRKKPL